MLNIKLKPGFVAMHKCKPKGYYYLSLPFVKTFCQATERQQSWSPKIPMLVVKPK